MLRMTEEAVQELFTKMTYNCAQKFLGGDPQLHLHVPNNAPARGVHHGLCGNLHAQRRQVPPLRGRCGVPSSTPIRPKTPPTATSSQAMSLTTLQLCTGLAAEPLRRDGKEQKDEGVVEHKERTI